MHRLLSEEAEEKEGEPTPPWMTAIGISLHITQLHLTMLDINLVRHLLALEAEGYVALTPLRREDQEAEGGEGR